MSTKTVLPTAVNDKHQFKKSDLLYRFRYDDGTFRFKYEGSDLLARVSRHPTVLVSLSYPHPFFSPGPENLLSTAWSV